MRPLLLLRWAWKRTRDSESNIISWYSKVLSNKNRRDLHVCQWSFICHVTKYFNKSLEGYAIHRLYLVYTNHLYSQKEFQRRYKRFALHFKDFPRFDQLMRMALFCNLFQCVSFSYLESKRIPLPIITLFLFLWGEKNNLQHCMVSILIRSICSEWKKSKFQQE